MMALLIASTKATHALKSSSKFLRFVNLFPLCYFKGDALYLPSKIGLNLPDHYSPPGLGKTHLSIAPGFEAIEKGSSVCFERVSNLMRILKTSDLQRTSRFRLNRILKSICSLLMKLDILLLKSGKPIYSSILSVRCMKSSQ